MYKYICTYIYIYIYIHIYIYLYIFICIYILDDNKVVSILNLLLSVVKRLDLTWYIPQISFLSMGSNVFGSLMVFH